MLFDSIPFFWHKLISTGALLLITIVFSYLPFVIKKRVRRAGLIMSYCNCLAGGIVLGAMLMHMIPEIMEGCGHDHHDHAVAAHAAIPKPSNLLGVHFHGDHKHDHDHKKCDHGHKKCDHDHTKGDKIEAKAATTDGHDHGHEHGFAWGPFFAGVSFLILFAVDRLFLSHDHGHEVPAAPKKKTETPPATSHAHAHVHGAGCSHSHEKHHHITIDEEAGHSHEEEHTGGCQHMDVINASSTKAQTFVFVLALSIHSFLEGLGMATKNTWGGLMSFLISLFAHKWLEAFALGTGVAKACFSAFHSFWLISVYAILTPAGILLGMWMDSASKTSTVLDHKLVHSMLDGMALGSFLFVSCIEMIPSEFQKQNKHSPFKFAILCLGFVAMAGISMLHFH